MYPTHNNNNNKVLQDIQMDIYNKCANNLRARALPRISFICKLQGLGDWRNVNSTTLNISTVPDIGGLSVQLPPRI